MTLDTFNALIQSLSTLLVAVTLAFTYRQLRETSRQSKNLDTALKTSVSESVTEGQRNIWSTLFSDPALLRWYLSRRFIKVESDDSLNKIKGFAALKLDFYETLYLQNKQKNLSDNIWSSWINALKLDMEDQLVQEVWRCMKINGLYDPSFVRFVEKAIGL